MCSVCIAKWVVVSLTDPTGLFFYGPTVGPGEGHFDLPLSVRAAMCVFACARSFFPHFASHEALKVLELESNFTGMLISMWSCASWVTGVDLFSFVKVIALVADSSISIWQRVMKINGNVGQHDCVIMQRGVCLWIYSAFVELLLLT
jgi:hypothetical protein